MKRDPRGHWTCPHGIVTGFFPVPGHPLLIEHRSCDICCEEISERMMPRNEPSPPKRFDRCPVAIEDNGLPGGRLVCVDGYVMGYICGVEPAQDMTPSR